MAVKFLRHIFYSFTCLQSQLLAEDDGNTLAHTEKYQSSHQSENPIMFNGDDPIEADNEIRRMLTDLLIDNARLHKQVNSVIRRALKTVVDPEKDDGQSPFRKSALNRFLER